MKTHLFIVSLMLLVLFGACNSGSVMTNATGLAYEVVVTMDQKDWKGEAGELIKADLGSPVPGLPQVEPSLRITYVQPHDFNGLLKYVRNILIVKIDPSVYSKVSLSYEYDVWAKGQVVLTMKAPDAAAIVEYLKANKDKLANFFVDVEINRAIAQLEKKYSSVVMEQLESKHDLMLNAPENMTYYKDTTDFFWASNNANTGRTDLVVYTFPYTDPNTFTADYLVAKRDSVLKANLPGAFPDSYMATETRGGIQYTPITINGKYCGVLRGLWRMEGDMMGGPFVSHVRLDEKNNRVVVAEGFVFAPETNKRNFIRRIEAALYTLRLPGEFDKPVSAPLDVSKQQK
ncbi:DUF4837 family protein [Parabacteroides bouchesdurhonensis]|uniref:DUF4837 family protein n=1 Tax=Parabacteroides bouchesdurhonensis TaxID=1936995 RepID=UPI000E54D363|nr:DUF4837 family protein [Parabacteroides bouchesdurhonensis]RHJ95327.1 DUF4837 family protein [Bacteroides sp. AM07-16]